MVTAAHFLYSAKLEQRAEIIIFLINNYVFVAYLLHIYCITHIISIA